MGCARREPGPDLCVEIVSPSNSSAEGSAFPDARAAAGAVQPGGTLPGAGSQLACVEPATGRPPGPPKNEPPDISAGRLSTRCTRQQNKVKAGRVLAPVSSSEDMTDTGSRTARTRRSTAERLLSWGSPPFQRSSRRAVARSLVPRSPFVVGLRPDPGVFPTAGGCDRSKTVAPPLLGLVPLQSMTGSAAGALSGSDASRGVSCPYSASGHGSPLIRDLPRPGSGAATGFRTLLPPCFSRVPPTG